MRTDEEFRGLINEKRDRYLAARRRRNRALMKAGMGVVCVALVIAAALIIPMSTEPAVTAEVSHAGETFELSAEDAETIADSIASISLSQPRIASAYTNSEASEQPEYLLTVSIDGEETTYRIRLDETGCMLYSSGAWLPMVNADELVAILQELSEQ